MSLNKVFTFFFYYIPYRTYLYYKTSPTPKFSTFILLLFLSSSNIISIFFILNQINNWRYTILTENKMMNKFVFIPLFLSPLVVAILSFYYVKKEKVREMNKYYTNMPSSEKSRLNLLFWLYVTASIIFFLSGVMSPLWL